MHDDAVHVLQVEDDAADDAVFGSAVKSAPASATVFDLFVSGVVRLSFRPPDRVVLNWMSSPGADVVADSLVAVIAHADVSAACMRIRTSCCGSKSHDHSHTAAAGGSVGEGTESHAPVDAEAVKAQQDLLADLNKMFGPGAAFKPI